MASLHVSVTAEHIEAAGPVLSPEGTERALTASHRDPVERAIGEITGQDVSCDGDTLEDGLPQHEIATIGQGATTLVVNLPPEEHDWIVRYFAGEPVEPFEFDLEIEPWLVALIAKCATTLEQAEAVIAAEHAA